MSLNLIGVGPYDEQDITLRGIEIIKKSDCLYIDGYTSFWHGKEGLEKKVGIEIKRLDRSDLEEDIEYILEKAKSKDVSILIPGDPMIATTHVEIVLQANRRNIETHIVHAPSIYSIVAETGLQIYKFGKTTTIPFTKGNYKPVSPYKTIKNNLENGLHTLALLDIKDNKMMSIKEAIDYLLEIEDEIQEEIITEERYVVGYNYSGEKSTVLFDKISNIRKEELDKPSVLIIPSKLHEKEREALQLMSR